MKAKIFAKLKQDYASLGLGEEVLMGQAEALAATGLVTDENIDLVVASQRKNLENLQRNADSRVSKALEKQRKEHEEEIKKIREEAAKGGNEPKDKDIPEWYAREREAQKAAAEQREKQFNELLEASKQKYEDSVNKLLEENKKLSSDYQSLRDESEAAKSAKAKAERIAKIKSTAEKLGVPQWRIDEGFNIADDANDEAINATLSTIANNIKTNLLPGNRSGFTLDGKEPSKEEVDSIANSLVK